MSLRSKIVGTLLGVLVLYVLAAWMVLSLIHTPAFESLERTHADEQLLRVSEFINAERDDVDLFVTDWAAWDDTMLYARGENDEFYEEHLSGGYLGQLGMSFGAIVDANGRLVWGQAFQTDGSITSLDYLFPSGILTGSALLRPNELDEHVSGLIDTAQGPAVVASAAILWSDGSGPPGGHLFAGKLLDAERMLTIGQTLLSSVDLFPMSSVNIPQGFQQAVSELTKDDSTPVIIKQGNSVYALTVLHDVEGQSVSILRVRSNADISRLGTQTLRTTIVMLIVAAVVLTITLWLVLKGMFLLPIEHLTAVLRGGGNGVSSDENSNLHSTMKRLTDSQGTFSQRNDEIGELISAFDDLSHSLRDATNNVWRIAHQDGLTGLANRRFIMERFCSIISKPHDKRSIALLFIDLDDFKAVNDHLGHEAGDKLLIEAAYRIQSVVGTNGRVFGPEDTGRDNIVARIGGDEFVIMLAEGDLPDSAYDVAARIVETVAAPYSIADEQCTIGACVGLALYPDDAENLEGMLANADAAMYEAKRAGKNTWRRYGQSLSSVELRKRA